MAGTFWKEKMIAPKEPLMKHTDYSKRREANRNRPQPKKKPVEMILVSGWTEGGHMVERKRPKS